MNMTGTVYRPPYEANSLLLQMTLGCSHNKFEAVRETREQLRAHLDEFPARGGEGSILNR